MSFSRCMPSILKGTCWTCMRIESLQVHNWSDASILLWDRKQLRDEAMLACRLVMGRNAMTRTQTPFDNTREMQGIVGQASNFELRGQLSAFCARERLSQSSTELSCRRFDEERSKKSKRSTTNVVVRFFCVHISPRTSSTVVRVQVVGVSKVRTVAGMPGLVIALDTACACQ